MKRGDVVLVRADNSPASKARPCLIVQRSSALAGTTKVTFCPFTTELRGAAGCRPFVAPTLSNGLMKPSEVEVDWVFTKPVDNIGKAIGAVDEPTMRLVDAALRDWLDL